MQEFLRALVERLSEEVKLFYSDRLVSFTVFGSVGRGTATAESDIDFLIVANWTKGKLLREYTVLLDPPVTAPAAGAATLSPAQEAPRAKPQPLPPEHEHAAQKPEVLQVEG